MTCRVSSAPQFLGPSRNSGKGAPDFEEEVGGVPEAVGHALDHLDLVVDPLQEAGVEFDGGGVAPIW